MLLADSHWSTPSPQTSMQASPVAQSPPALQTPWGPHHIVMRVGSNAHCVPAAHDAEEVHPA